MCFSKKKKKQFQFNYSINRTQLLTVSKFKYLGVYFTTGLFWTRHIDHITAKTTRVLGFMKRNTKQFPIKAKAILHFSSVQSILEYASMVWQLWTQTNIDKLERVQSRAVHFVFKNYTRNFSVTKAKKKIGWYTLQKDV